MKRTLRIFALLLAAMLAIPGFAGCHGGESGVYDTPEPIVTPDPADPTEVPEFLRTPDPALYQLTEDGIFEDEYLTMQMPSYMGFYTFSSPNSADYIGTMPSGNRLAFNYTWDTGGSFDEECANFTFDSYQEYLTTQMNSYFYLEEFAYVTVDGHTALRSIFRYEPPNDPDHLTHALQYLINVNGWILSMGYSSLDEIPAECEADIRAIKFKAGY